MHALLIAWHAETGQPAFISANFHQANELIIGDGDGAFDALAVP